MKLYFILAVAARSVNFLRSRGDRWPPKAPDYAWWASTYGDFAPVEVCDSCGGTPGVTKWEELSKTCATWALTVVRSVQLCIQTNNQKGFSACMAKLGVKSPQCSELQCVHCDGGNDEQGTTKYCREVAGWWNSCKCAKDGEFESVQEWSKCVDSCVYDCDRGLQAELNLEYPISWRKRKCGTYFYACGGVESKTCTRVPACETMYSADCVEKVCGFPIGSGHAACHGDDPFCGGRANEEARPMTDKCLKPLAEGDKCDKYPLWNKAESYPRCEEPLICGNKTGLCQTPRSSARENSANTTDVTLAESIALIVLPWTRAAVSVHNV